MKVLDLFCGGGGASVGYHRAGFEVMGLDINDQPDYPFPFIKGDAIKFLEDYVNNTSGKHYFDTDMFHASPPCQAYSYATTQWKNKGNVYPDLVKRVRELLLLSGVPFVIENVTNSPLRKDLVLCGQMFNLNVYRHRVFELGGVIVPQIPHEKHTGHIGDGKMISVFGHGGGVRYKHCTSDLKVWKEAMGISWITKRKTLTESIPPAYTEYIGRCILTTNQLVRENDRAL